MRLLTVENDGHAAFAFLAGDDVILVSEARTAFADAHAEAGALPTTIEAFLADTPRFDAPLRAVVAAAERGERQVTRRPQAAVTLLPVIPRPTKIVCVARNYAEHARESGMEMPTIPILFPRFAATLIADGAPIVVPAVSDNLDWEGELAVIIGRHTRGRRIGRDEAMDYVYGYTIFNDVTVRDYQFRVTQYTAGKNFRHSGPFGPVIVTADEIDVRNLDIVTRLNGKIEQQANASTMIFDVPTILEHIADFVDLEGGDVIPTGTPAGVGFKRKPPVFLKDGDTISVEIAGIGTLTNPVIGEGRN